MHSPPTVGAGHHDVRMTKEEVAQLFDTHICTHPAWARATMGPRVPEWLTQMWAEVMMLAAGDVLEYVDGSFGEGDDRRLEGSLWAYTSKRLIRATVEFNAGRAGTRTWAVARSSLSRVEVTRAWGGADVWPPGGAQIRAEYPGESVLLPVGFPSDDLEARFHEFLPSLLDDLSHATARPNMEGVRQ